VSLYLFDVFQELLVNKATSPLVQGAVDSDHIALGNEFLGGVNKITEVR
jgi:hypothetical protein